MASSISPNLISFVGIGNRPSTSPSFSCSNQIQNEVPTVSSVLVRAPPRKNLPRTGLSITLYRRTSRLLTNYNSDANSSDEKKGGVSNSNYIVPPDGSFPISKSPHKTCRPLAEILSDFNNKIPANIVKAHVHGHPPAGTPHIPWSLAIRMMNFYAPGWKGEIRNIMLSDDGSVTLVYRITVYGSDGMTHGESTGTVYPYNPLADSVTKVAKKLAFCKACARLGLGLYLYHEG